jgi:peptidoglycan/xylan/chitin deacetylase (PgdA/CDA1 family)/folate-dependent phosphoribosylglycinamide formyltransferase PurN
MIRPVSPFRVVVLTGWDAPSTRQAVTKLLTISGLEVAGIVYDRGVYSLKTRLRRFWKRGRREGIVYLLGQLAARILRLPGSFRRRSFDPRPSRQAIFPHDLDSLRDLATRHGIPYGTVDSLNSPEAQRHISSLNADLGIVIGTRIIKRDTFTLPRLGCINVHKGRVPEYRGQPPAFWELYNGETEAGVTIHLVAEKLDAGDIVTEASLPIATTETEHSLKLKLDRLALDLLTKAVQLLARGQATPRPQTPSTLPVYTVPTRAQRADLARRLGTTPESFVKRSVRTILYHICLNGGPIWLRNLWLRLCRRTRVTVLLFHRVNDVSVDNLTTSVDRFIEYMAMLKKQYPVLSLSELVSETSTGRYLGPNVVAVTFDDGYADNYDVAAPILQHFGIPATFFVTAGLVSTPGIFTHDQRSPHTFTNLSWDQVKGLVTRGFEIGSHGMTHANLGRVPLREAIREIRDSRETLQRFLSTPIRSFAYPFGGREDISPAAVREIRAAGFTLIASAYGGSNTAPIDPNNICRVGVSNAFDVLALRAKIEGVYLQDIRREIRALWGLRDPLKSRRDMDPVPVTEEKQESA